MPLRRVVITGMGAVSPYGSGVPVMMEGLYACRSAVVDMKAEWEKTIRDLSCWIGAPIPVDLNEKSIERKYRRTMGRTAILACLASREALAQAQVPTSWFPSGKMGVSFGSTTGSVSCMETILTECIRNTSLQNIPSGSFFQMMSHTAAANLAHAFDIRGLMIAPSSACTSSAQAIGFAFDNIQFGRQDIMLCGGADELHAIVSGSFDLVHAASWHFNDEPGRSPRPFDRDRDGTVCGEGSGALVLEAEEVARARGADILCEVLGFASSTDGTHLAESHADSIALCIQNALDKCGLMAENLDYINAHATGTVVGDMAEAEAIRNVFGDNAVPVSSLKGAMGHTLGACSALELIASVEMAKRGVLVPTLNLDSPGEGCEGIEHFGAVREGRYTTFMKNSFAFGGTNCVLILKRYGNE